MIELKPIKCCKKPMKLRNSYYFEADRDSIGHTYFAFQCDVCGKVKEVNEEETP